MTGGRSGSACGRKGVNVTRASTARQQADGYPDCEDCTSLRGAMLLILGSLRQG